MEESNRVVCPLSRAIWYETVYDTTIVVVQHDFFKYQWVARTGKCTHAHERSSRRQRKAQHSPGFSRPKTWIDPSDLPRRQQTWQYTRLQAVVVSPWSSYYTVVYLLCLYISLFLIPGRVVIAVTSFCTRETAKMFIRRSAPGRPIQLPVGTAFVVTANSSYDTVSKSPYTTSVLVTAPQHVR